MLETLLSLPVYLAILSGIFWLGELCLARQGLTTADRLRLYESVCRHSSSAVAGRNIFSSFESSTDSRPQLVTGAGRLTFNRSVQTETSSMGWFVGVTGQSKLTVRRSDWSWGIINFLWPTIAGNSANAAEMISYGTREQPLSSSLFSRTPNATPGFERAGEGSYNNSVNWFSIAAGVSVSPSELAANGITALPFYARNTQLYPFIP